MMSRKKASTVAALAGLALAVAAATAAEASFFRGAPDGSPAYKEGWRHGCWEGLDAGGWVQYGPYARLPDDARYAGDPDYGRGKAEALALCYEKAVNRPQDWGR